MSHYLVKYGDDLIAEGMRAFYETLLSTADKEELQRLQMKEKFKNRKPTPATEDFDIPEGQS